jgi:arginyl-tRNA synthetase
VFPHEQIQARLQTAVQSVLPSADVSNVLVRPCPDPKFGDYQANALMSLAKERNMNPRQFATDVLKHLDVRDWCEKVEIAGAGFINFRLSAVALGHTLAAAARGEHLFFTVAAQPRTFVVDFSSPNVAKPMHVGHIRSTILGDSIARLLRLLGNRVITDNHLGDWGTQFGMLLLGWKRHRRDTGKEAFDIETLVELYRGIQTEIETQTRQAVQKRYPERWAELRQQAMPENDVVKELLKELGPQKPLDLSKTEMESKEELVKLQAGDAENISIWKKMIDRSMAEFNAIYKRLGVRFDHTFGESFYDPRLEPLVRELQSKGIAVESQGALAVFLEEPQVKGTPALVRKSDGAFNYTTTDLATIQYRLETWHPDEVVYITDARQQFHFQQFFAVFRRWQPEVRVKLTHIWFGSILGEDGKPFKTRSGDTVRLSELLDEAEERALALVSAKNPELSEGTRKEIARVVGLGAVKYADLLPNRETDYVFSWDKMLALNGNTAPYLQYAYARIRSIFRKGGLESGGSSARVQEVRLDAPPELNLARHLINFGLELEVVAKDYKPNLLCNYLYDLAGRFTAFYENCPVLKAEGDQRTSRLVLCDLTARVLKQGLEILGIETLEQM